MLSRTNRRDRRGALPQRVPVPMLVLSAFIVLGVILGYVFALRSLQSADGELKQYFDAFLSGGVNRPFSVRALGETLLCYFRAPGIVFLLGFASIGIVAVPLVCACQGFLLSYSLFCFALSLGRGSFPLLLALFGLFAGLKLPNLTWTNEITPIKQGGSVMLALFGGFVYAGLLPLAYFLGASALGLSACLGIYLGLTLALSAVLYVWLRRRGAAVFAAL